MCVVAFVVASPACYTLLKHPKVKRDVYEEVADNRCTNCHYEDELWAFHHPPNHPSAYPVGWDEYYLVPWWYDAYWHFEPGGGVTVPVQSRRIRPGANNLTTTPGGAVSTTPIKATSASPATAEGQPNKGNNNDSSSKNRTVRPGTEKKDGKQKEKEKG